MALFTRRTKPQVTHLIEIECPVTGRSRMFSGTDPDEVADQANAWLESVFGGEHDPADREVAWEV